jgi:hypothetical protein
MARQGILTAQTVSWERLDVVGCTLGSAGILRLRGCFAPRISHSAQDDRAVEIGHCRGLI